MDNSSFERAEEFRYLGKNLLTNQNSIQEEIKIKLISGKPCCLSVQNPLSSNLLSKNLKIKMYGTIILPVVLYGCETWSLTLEDVHRLRVFENRVPRRLFGPKRDEIKGEWRKLHNEEMYSSPSIFRVMQSKRIRWTGHAAHMGEKRGM